MRNSFYVVIIVPALTLAGCQTIDNAGLVYGSRTVGGIDVSGGPQGSTGGANFSFGYKREDLAFIPVAVCEKKDGKGCQNIAKLIGSNGQIGPSATRSEDIAAVSSIIGENASTAEAKADKIVKRLGMETTGGAVAITKEVIADPNVEPGEKAKRVIKALQGLGSDSYSVFGSFEGRGFASASAVDASVGNLFATGIAAQNLSRYIGTAMANRSFAYCLGEVRRAQNVKDDQPLSETQMRLCLKI